MDASGTQNEWQRNLASKQEKARELFGRDEFRQRELGYFFTLKEICQQPWTWLRTSEQMIQCREMLRSALRGVEAVVLTGSGSSGYVGDCVRVPLQNEMRKHVESIAGGVLLLQGVTALPNHDQGLLVSLARSGNSPESAAVVKLISETAPTYRHLVVTCNKDGALAKNWNGRQNASVIALPPETNDESLVMTSSFTNLLLAARFFGMLDRADEYQRRISTLSGVVRDLIEQNFDLLAKAASLGFRRAAVLGSGTRHGAAREGALKMLEMSAGRVTVLAESYLGLRHGPMSFVHEDTLIVCQLSNDPTTRAYESDLLAELDKKRLGLAKLIVGEQVPSTVVRDGDIVVNCPGLAQIPDDDTAAVFVVVAQMLAFFRCLEEGLHPDSPSEDGVINRVVESFPLHS